MGLYLHGQRRGCTDRPAVWDDRVGGLANTFFWIDRKKGLGGYWATQILPFSDPISFGGYLEFETAVYAAPHDALFVL